MKALKIVFAALGGLVALAVLGIGVALLVIDGKFVKSKLEAEMKARNRTLVIEGDPKLSLFPVARLALGKTTLSEAGSDKLFVSLDELDLAVRVMPLLSREVAVEALKLSGLRANVVKRKDGSFNFSDLAGGGKKEAAGHKGDEAPPNIRLSGMQVEKVQLTYRDEATGQEMTVSDVSLKTGKLDGAEPGEVGLALRLTGKRPEVDLRAQVTGALRFNLAREEFAFDKFAVTLKGRADQDNLALDFSAPKVEVTPSRATGSEVKGTLSVKGPQRNLEAKLRIAAVEGSAAALSIPGISLELDATAGGLPPVKAKLDAAVKANLAKQDLNADVKGRLDESNLAAKVALSKFSPLALNFDVTLDRLNLDRYLPAEKKEAKSDDKVDLSGLRGPTVNGKVAIGALTAKRVKMENVKAEIKLAGGKLDVSNSVGLYGGTVAGTLTADANGNRIVVKENVQGVAVGPLLRDAAQKDLLEGKATATIDVNTAGATVTALKKALAGTARVELKDGAIKGVNLAESSRNLKSALGAKQAKPDPSQKTDFSEMTATFNIKGGVAHNDDLKAQSPFLRLGGAGNIDIGGNALDYLAKATLVATSKGQGGREAGNVAGITIPVKLSGALDNPQWNIDYSGLLGGAAGGAAGAAGAVTDTVKQGASGVKDAVRGLFKR